MWWTFPPLPCTRNGAAVLQGEDHKARELQISKRAGSRYWNHSILYFNISTELELYYKLILEMVEMGSKSAGHLD